MIGRGRRWRRWAAVLGVSAVFASVSALIGQTTQSLIRGRVTDQTTGEPVPGLTVAWEGETDGQRGHIAASAGGYFWIPSLSPGVYRVVLTASGFQPQELHSLNVPIAATLELDLKLRPLSDVWEQGMYRSALPQGSGGVLTLVGPDLDRSRTLIYLAPGKASGGLEAAVSEVVTSMKLRSLPLAGCDTYGFLAALPGVTADTTTARGLGLSVNGQRPSASSFLLDGVDSNNYLTSGPLLVVPPEAIEEYRATFSNFSAEYGSTTGYLANAVTRSGGNRWHGLAWYYLNHDSLNANGFQQNRLGISRRAQKEAHPGITIGGPLRRDEAFISMTAEYFRTRVQQDPFEVEVPSRAYPFYTAPGSAPRALLDRFGAWLPDAGILPIAKLTISPVAALNRRFLLLRSDRHLDKGAQRLFGRLIGGQTDRPDFIWTPYPDFRSPLRHNTVGGVAGAMITWTPALVSELRAAISADDLRWDRANAAIPTLETTSGVILPGSPAFYSYRNRLLTAEFRASLQRASSHHVLKLGGGWLERRLSGYLTAGRDGRFVFDDYLDFGASSASYFQVGVDRASWPQLVQPDYHRRWRNRQTSVYVQDSWRVTSALTINAGVRYELFGAPASATATRHTELLLGPGQSLPNKLANATLWFPSGSGHTLYDSDRNNVSGRLGLSWHVPGRPGTTFRAAYGLFYDRGFDNLWQNLGSNQSILVTAPTDHPTGGLLAPIRETLDRYANRSIPMDFPALLLYQPGIRTPYAHSIFAGLGQRWGALEIEGRYLASLARKLLTTDQVNRQFSQASQPDNPLGRLNPEFGTISYRANQGSSSYHALTTTIRYRRPGVDISGTWTWSHAIDNQSEPLAGDFFNLDFTRLNFQGTSNNVAAFSKQFDSRADRGNADFDQRHNLVLVGFAEVPRFRNWQVAVFAAFRSGFPFSVIAADSGLDESETIVNRRANLVGPFAAVIAQESAGGRLLLNKAAFSAAPTGQQGNLGRNALVGPGLYSVDGSISRTFVVREGKRLTLRLDILNILNHSNLNNPAANIDERDFGLALRGRLGKDSGFPALIPLNENPRRIQVMLRWDF